MVSIALVMAVIVTNLYLRKDSNYRVPLCVRRIFLGRTTKKVRKNSLPPTPKILLNDNHHHVSQQHDNNVITTKFHDQIEIDNVSHMSEMDGLTSGTCPNDRCFKPRGGGGQNGGGCGGGVGMGYGHHQEVDQSLVISQEWQQLARMVDRICFWLFLFSSIAALSTMFTTIPQYN